MTTTLKDACEAYIAHMKTKGQSPSTLGTIQRTLALLIEEMGEDKEVGKILPVHVDRFFKSENATQQPGKDGMKPRAQASILQIRRITRMALVWWKEAGYTERLALPGDEKKFLEKRTEEKPAEEAPAKRGRKPKAAAEVEAEPERDPEAEEELHLPPAATTSEEA